MPVDPKKIEAAFGAKHVATLPQTGGGVTGAALAGHIVQQIQEERLQIRQDVARRINRYAKRVAANGTPTNGSELASRILDEAIAKLEQEFVAHASAS